MKKNYKKKKPKMRNIRKGQKWKKNKKKVKIKTNLYFMHNFPLQKLVI